MIIESILKALKAVLFAVFSWLDLPNISDFGDGFQQAFELVPEILDSAQSIINLFLPWSIVKFGFPIIIIILGFEHVYHFVLWVIKKIPMLGIE